MAYLTNTVKDVEGTEISIDDSYKLKDYELEGDTYQATLPSEYTAVEYIQNDKYPLTYIDTKVQWNKSTSIVAEFETVSTGTNNNKLFIASDGDTSNPAQPYVYINTSNNVVGVAASSTIGGYVTGEIVTINYNVPLSKRILITTWSDTTWGSVFKYKRFKIYNADFILRDMIPCYRNSDNAIGMYDLVEEKFYQNNGTGTFIKGNNIETPSPKMPQDVQIVTGEQNIKILGKNYANFPVNASLPRNSMDTIVDFGKDVTVPSLTLSFIMNNAKFTNSNNAAVVDFLKDDGTHQYRISGHYNMLIDTILNGTFKRTETNITFRYINVYLVSTFSGFTQGTCSIQLENGSTATEFEEYKAKTYPINLGKNYFDISKVISSNNVINNNNGTITVIGYAQSSLSPNKLKDYCPDLKTGDVVTLTATTNSPNQFIYLVGVNQLWNFGKTKTITKSDLDSGILWYGQTGSTTPYIISNIMIRKVGASAEYQPYIKPIKLGKIEALKDNIRKAKAINLFDIGDRNGYVNYGEAETGSPPSWLTSVSNNTLTMTIQGSGNTTTYREQRQEGNKTYTLSSIFSGTGGRFFVRFRDENNTRWFNSDDLTLSGWSYNQYYKGWFKDFSTKGSTVSITINAPECLFWQFGLGYASIDVGTTQTICNIQIQEGSMTKYEPYLPINTWFVEKKTNSIILNGSETGWNIFKDGSNIWNYYINKPDIKKNFTNLYCISNYFKYNTSVSNNQKGWFSIGGYTTTKNGNIVINPFDDTTSDLANFKTWLGTHNMEVVYPLEIPTYETITNQELIDQLNAIELLEGVNEITVDSVNLPATLDLDYYSQENPYQDAVYSQDDKNDLKIYFNDVELEDAGRYCEKITRTARIIPNDGGKRFNLDNFISTSIEVILHNVDLEDIVDQVRIEIGTDIGNNTYQYIPLGIFNIQDTPVKDGNKITLKLRDNRVKFDFNYNAYPLMQELGGTATKRQILEDICEKAGVENVIEHFDNEDDVLGIYDDTITATTYVSYLMEQAGLIATINRDGKLAAIDLSKIDKWRIPLSIVESYEKGEPYSIERVVYEGGTIKYQTSEDETLDTLYLNSANPYISSDTQVENILNKLSDFEIDSIITKRVLGNPAIDPYDIIEIYNDLDQTNNIVFRTLANTTYTFNGVHRDTFDTQIGKEQRTENVSKNSQASFQRYAKAEIDNVKATITQTVVEVEELQESIELFSVDLSQYNLIVATDNTQKPYTTETLSVNYYGYYKGQQVTPTVSISGSQTGVTTSSSSTAINFAVSNATAIQNKSYTYTITFTYNADNSTYTVIKKIVVALSMQGQQGQQGQPGTAGTSAYFYVRYSKNSDGNPMTTSPQSDTQYMGVASTTSPTAPTSYSAYTWSKTKGETGQQGIPGPSGEDGTSSYFHIKWSNDGETFTPAEGTTPIGKTPGRWQGTYVDTNPTDSSTFSDYNWVDTGIYVQDELNTLQTNIDNVDSRVTDTNTNLNNNYYNKDQVDAKSDANANSIATVSQRVVQLEQTNSQFSINVQRVIDQYGASKVTTATGYVFDENGMNISKTGSEMSNLLDNTGMFVRRNSTEMLGADATGVRSENLWVRKYLQMGNNSRFEDYENNRTACFYIGGSN